MQTSQKSLLLFVLLAACNDDPGSLRVVHASPGAPPLDVYVDDATLPFATVAYGQTSPYVDIDAGDHNLFVYIAGTANLVFESSEIKLDDDDSVTTIAAGDIGSIDPAMSFRLLPLFEDFGDKQDNEAEIRIVNTLTALPAVDIDLGDDGTIDFASLDRFDETSANGFELAANVPHQLAVRANGVRLSGFTVPALPSRSESFVIVTGILDQLPREATSLSLFAVADNGVLADIPQNPTVYTLHVVPDAGPVDVSLNGVLTYIDLAFSELMPVQVAPGDYTFTFSPTGNPDLVVASARVVGLAAGQRYLAIASGMVTPLDVGEERFNVAVYLDAFINDDLPRIRAINSSPDSPIIDVSTVTGGAMDAPPLFSELQFTEAGDDAGLVVGRSPSIRLGVATTKTSTPFAQFDLNTSAATPHEFLVMAGAVSPTADEQFYRMFRVDTRPTPWSIGTTSVLAQ